MSAWVFGVLAAVTVLVVGALGLVLLVASFLIAGWASLNSFSPSCAASGAGWASNAAAPRNSNPAPVEGRVGIGKMRLAVICWRVIVVSLAGQAQPCLVL